MPRPWWMTALLGFCVYMTFVYMPFDVFWKPVEVDTEVWLGFPLHGWWAKATEPLHWAIYAFGAWGFWKMKRRMHPWAPVYTASIAIGMLVWTATDPRVGSPWLGLVPFTAFAALAVALWRARVRFVS